MDLSEHLTGDAVRAVQFRDRLRGYDPADVDPLLDELADAIDKASDELTRIEAANAREPEPLLDPGPRVAWPDVARLAAMLHVAEAVRRGRAMVAAAEARYHLAEDETRRNRARALARTLLEAGRRPTEERPAITVPPMEEPAVTDLPTPERRCLLTVHAHPDDEASKGAGTIAKYHAMGARTVLVCCTGGEAGDILNPVMDTPEVRSQLAQVRRAELELAAQVIGYDEVVMLGYHDSGMPDSEANHNPDCFARAALDEAAARLVAVLRRERPQVVVTYPEKQERYPHPDHLRVHEVTMAAVDAAADPARYPEAGPPWKVSKIYYSAWSRARLIATHEKFGELGLESPYQPAWFEGPDPDLELTTRIDLSGGFEDVRREALLAHATQIDPNSPFWFGLPPEVAREIHPYDDYVLARGPSAGERPETDLFAGIPALVSP